MFRYALKTYLPIAEVEKLAELHATSWDEYEWYQPTGEEDGLSTYGSPEMDEFEYCEECGIAFEYDGFINPTLCDHCSYNTWIEHDGP